MRDKPNVIVALGTWTNKLVHIPALTALRKAEVTHLFDQGDATPYELNKHWKHDSISGDNTIRWLGESPPPPPSARPSHTKTHQRVTVNG